MTNPETQIANRFLAMQRPVGRWHHQLRAASKRAAWWLTIASLQKIKRLFDIMVSAIALFCLLPVFAMIVLFIKLEDGGPILFAQTRVGRFGRLFKMYKFRSMCMNAEEKMKELMAQNQHAEGVTFKIKNDPRVTKTGKWLRKFSLDELPQFFNVLTGDMSVVGPRPPVPREVAKYTLADRRRLLVTPGITCLWQIGGRSEIDFSGQVELDVRYIESQSFWGDVLILLKTVPAVLMSKGAY